MASESLQSAFEALRAAILSSPSNAAALAGMATHGLSGAPAADARPIALLAEEGGTVGTCHALAGFAPFLEAAVAERGSCPGRLALAAIGWREGDGISAALVGFELDTRRERGDSPVMVPVKGGWIACPKGIPWIAPLLPDGTLLDAVTGAAVDDAVMGAAPTLSDIVPSPFARRVSVANLRTCLRFAPGNARETAAASRTPSSVVHAEIPAAHRAHVAPPAPKRKAEPKGPSIRVDLDKLAERLRGLSRPAWILETHEGRHDEPGIAGSGGTGAFLPRGEAWPTSGSSPLRPVIQLDVAAMPPAVRDILGGSGAFQLFAGDGADGMGAFVARALPHGIDGGWVPFPGTSDGRGIVVGGFREVRDAPGLADLTEGPSPVVGKRLSTTQADLVDMVGPAMDGQVRAAPAEVARVAADERMDGTALEAVAELLGHYGGDKVGGWPSWAQSPEWPGKPAGKGMALVLQLRLGASDGVPVAPDLLAGDGTLQVFCSTDGKRRFEVTWACG